ncbi:hypothetical protein PIB30_006915 [Stylosanthes scabra]|uniref:Uncharacterized protein n=1 Tax=Stylosanthes scabra TaxID=79078 RepID=A0ABU6X1R6_9FABA|nr:hypothetical protein [Stylosanthes scabra]
MTSSIETNPNSLCLFDAGLAALGKGLPRLERALTIVYKMYLQGFRTTAVTGCTFIWRFYVKRYDLFREKIHRGSTRIWYGSCVDLVNGHFQNPRRTWAIHNDKGCLDEVIVDLGHPAQYSE